MRLRSGGQDDAARVDALGRLAGAAQFHRPRINDIGIGLQHIHAHGAVTLRAVVRRDSGDDAAHTLHNGSKVHLHLPGRYAKAMCLPRLVRNPGTLNQGFAGHAATIETIAAHLARFHQSHASLRMRGHIGRDQTTRSGADDDQVVIKARRSSPSCTH